ncbi:MAG: nucleotide exchange factor GrpE [Oligoflexales bacterium]|nr:nucleotide exchange factor GrpE [Oligoflexales bacterium]
MQDSQDQNKDREQKEIENDMESAAIQSQAEPGFAPGSELEQLQSECVRLKEEATNSHNQYLRALAEAENIRKRYQREQASHLRYSLENFFRELLPILDSLEKAVPSIPGSKGADSSDSVLLGVEMVRKQLFDILEKNGLSQMTVVGEKFDPSRHQAIRRVESPDVRVETIHEEYAKGYLLSDRLLRPAIVSVKVPVST